MWRVMKLCEKQLRDINPKDILNDGLYRRCDIYKGGGGYDKFSAIFAHRYNNNMSSNEQFVVQVQGCPFRCPYCYVTRDGVQNGEMVEVSTEKLVADFRKSKLPVFHLMGGAPALYIDNWCEIIKQLAPNEIFHSDLLLAEGYYAESVIEQISKLNKQVQNILCAVSIKGSTELEYKRKAGVALDKAMFWANFDTLVKYEFPYYLTFTGMTPESIENFKDKVRERYGRIKAEEIFADSFNIDLVKYKALEDI